MDKDKKVQNENGNKSIFKIGSITLVTIFTFKLLLDKDINQYNFFVDFYISITSVILIGIMVSTGVKLKDKYITYLVLGFLVNCFLTINHLDSMINKFTTSNSMLGDLTTNKNLGIDFSLVYFEVLIIEVSYFCFKRRLSYLKTVIFYLAVVFLNFCNYEYFVVNSTGGFKLLMNIIIMLVALSCVWVSLKRIRDLKENEKIFSIVKIYKYLLYITLFMILYFQGRNNGSVYQYIMFTFRYYAYLNILLLVEDNIIQENTIQYKNKFRLYQEKIKFSNSVLKYREKTLKDTEVKARASKRKYLSLLDNILSGVLIFNEGRLVYHNGISKRYLTSLQGIRYNKSNLSTILKELLGEGVNRSNFTVPISIDLFLNNKYNVEINIIEVKDNIVILIKDNTYLHKYIEVKREYDIYLKEEMAKEEFYAVISHELRTPINVIYSALQLNGQSIEKNNYDAINKNNEIIKSNCNRLIRTINNFIDANKIGDGYISQSRSIINIVQILDDLVEKTNGYFLSKNCTLLFDPQEEEIFIYANVEQINRVILNIFSNTLKYGKEHEEIILIVKKNQKQMILEINYKGFGISDEKINNMFDKFSNIGKYLTRRAEGSGLGMFISKKLIEQNGGIIKILSDNNNTSTIIYLPLANGKKLKCMNNYSLNSLSREIEIEFSDIYF